jgi:outer membrane immunogenic protein
MNKGVASAIAAAGIGIWLSFPASAADLPVYTKAPAAAPFGWTGFYVGGNIGYGPGTASNSLSFSQNDNPNSDNAFAFSATDSVRVKGVNGGAQAGYNWQVRNFLFGLETDFQASGERGTNTFAGTVLNLQTFLNAGNNPATVTDSVKLDWFGTTRARLGFVSDRWLVYGTGGVAYGELNLSGNIQPTNFAPAIQNGPIVWNQSTTRVGWTAGAGVENAITRNWSWKLEYLYVDLGTASAKLSGGIGIVGITPENCYGRSAGACNPAGNAAAGTITSRFTDNIVRLGVNYRFN